MDQKSLKYAKIFAGLGIAFLIPALILYFFPKDDLFSLSYEQAELKAKEQKKPVLMIIENQFNQKQNDFRIALNNSENLKDLLRNKFILAKSQKIMKELTRIPLLGPVTLSRNALILDWNMDLVAFVDFSKSSDEIYKELDLISNLDYLNWDSPENAQLKATNNGKQIIVLASTNVFGNIDMASLCKNKENIDYLKDNFNISYIGNKKNFETQYVNDVFMKNNIKSRFIMSPNITILIFDKSMTLLKYEEIRDFGNRSLQEIIEKDMIVVDNQQKN